MSRETRRFLRQRHAFTKASGSEDLAGDAKSPQPTGVRSVVGISARAGEGVDLLLQALQREVTNAVGRLGQGEGYMITR